jgi:RNA polymerase sigma factor (sigma-70 family)
MVRRLWDTALDRAATLALDELPDADLLSRFLADRAGPAFAAVVRRHGPLVWGVCRNLLPSEADAEDAFQATFLALAKGADGIRKPNALGAWLHGVAGRVCRTSLRAKAGRHRRERAAAVHEAQEPVSADAWDRWQTAVHEEVDRLPKPLREAFVLCVLQGVRQPDAAAALGWSLGTVSGRVCQAKKRLIAALGRRGVAGAAGLAALTGVRPVSAILIRRAAAVGAGGPVSEFVHHLARGAIGGIMGKTKLLVAGLLAAGLAVGTGLIPTAGGQVPGPATTAPPGNTPRANDPTMPAPRFGPATTAPVAAPSAAKWEYKFEASPRDERASMDLLTKLGADGWEYVGPLPASADRLVFKRPGRAGGQPWPAATVPAPTPMPRPRPGPRPVEPETDPLVLSEPAGFPRADGPNVLTPDRPAESPKIDRFRPPTVPDDPQVATDGFNPASLPSKTQAVIELAAGETIRHRMKTGAVIDRIKAGGRPAPTVEASPDPTDAKRVLIKAGTQAGDSYLMLTDANGVQESYTIRVKTGDRP